MMVFHASYMEVAAPDVVHSRKRLDFGAGFYVTTLEEQAERWREKFLSQSRPGIISVYELAGAALTECRTLMFGTYSDEWLDFVARCRMGIEADDYDMIIGGVANDKVFNTCELYFRGLIDRTTALGRLRYERPNEQICLKNQRTIDKYLRYVGTKKSKPTQRSENP